ncbi:hypothetical protein A3C89_00110 [Candidatus Kaiserbacteria bacterium RIFCSPHIGHO2_02_FULL_50_50]|uniref:Type II secretion system protein GspG C-terminal domain-containing protein n=1 Tax=Candidatus Kaiserbacteria bacterium RIFCSPHIGHO2_02_FULL_50_50 TaxID=1798492 RepID=A0A1F6DE64_9BACT|nr:MAG: hypothetical protein A3C89_00110 [Candidatus Kaiserbacteria bacterium RIFCSPHIGHO2_02_FULL_50_50]OGG88445.1 MAG: hypothetical protein A3G62_01760 [Candidatus Kaiserbacteria bacterium RIFCSPLOWO2_12_FULL_50_10]
MYTTRGFTLIELMVVITIIALLASGVLTALAAARAKARDARRTDDIAALMTGIELYHNDNVHGYPSPAGCTESACSITTLAPYLVPKYLEKLPVDPRSSVYHDYQYIVNGERDSYGLLLKYERFLPTNDTFCKRGSNVSASWFSTTYPTCP